MRLLIGLLFLISTTVAEAQVVINELCASNGDIKYDPDFYDFPAWVELYNKGGSAVDVGNHFLSDDNLVKNKWRIPSGTIIPAKGYLIIWCDDRNTRLHTNFNIDSDGEELVLSNGSQVVVDHVTFSEQYMNISYGRLQDGGTTLGYLVEPTPGAANRPTTGVLRLENPQLSLKSGRYSSVQSLTMQSVDQSVVAYTLDGSEPTLASQRYTAPVSITKTMTIKAKAFKDGFLPSKTEVKTYFINEHAFSLPVVSVSTKPEYLNSNTIGIYVDGTNGITGNCKDQPVNWNRDWDRHAVFEYFDEGGIKQFDQHVDIRIQGACGRNNPQKSLVLRARDKFGSKTIEYKFFPTKEIGEFGAVVLRNSGNDFSSTMFRDALLQSLTIGQMDIDYMSYQPAIVYLNGTYWGIMNIREKIDGDYIESNFGIGKDDVDLVETMGNAIEGTSERYERYIDSLKTIDRTTPEAFAFIDRNIDVQEFINYLTTEIYVCNTDWPGNNVKFWRQRSTNGKFRWILWDLDFGFGVYQDRSFPSHSTLDFATDPDNTQWPNPAESTLHLRLLLENPEFKKRFIQTFTTSLSTTFKPDRVIQMIDEFAQNIDAEMPYHLNRWGRNITNWRDEVQRMRIFASQRNTFMQTHVGAFFGYTDNVRVSINSFPVSGGAVEFNGIKSSSLHDGFYYRDLEFSASAKPNAGYHFTHYTIRKRQSENIPLIPKGALWKYSDMGTVPSDTWTSDAYDDSAWKVGAAELGYGDNDEATVVDFGPNIADKFITTYFRHTFSIADTVGLSSLSGGVLFDDGVVIYLNGEEVFRGNLPAGAIDNNTLATNQPNETAFLPFSIIKGKVKPGNNVLAVEVHQNINTSSDVSFNLELKTVRSGDETEYTLTDASFSDIANSDVLIEAHFAPVTPSNGLLINEVSVQDQQNEDNYGEKDDWVEVYNNGSETIDIANYFVTDKLSNKQKYRIKEGKNSETLIAPGEYKLLWADGDVNQGVLHMNFKLSAEGEAVGIYQKVGDEILTVDEVSFAPQMPFTTFSRIPNITGDFTMTSLATPLAENVFSIPVASDDEGKRDFAVYPNPTTSLIKVVFGEPRATYSLYDGTGRLIRHDVAVASGEGISFERESPGIFFLVISSHGKKYTQKIIRR